MTKPLLLFAHGAGAASTSPWMNRYATLFSAFARVVPFDYPYMANGRRRPDPLPRLIEAHRGALRAAREGHSGAVVLIGKSMGGRVGCHLALQESVDAVVCLGYPLRSMGKSKKLRDEVLLQLRTPVLFVLGTRDNLCPLLELERVRKGMRAPHELFVVEGGDHSLELPKGRLKAPAATETGAERPRTGADVERDVCERVARFVVGQHGRNDR